MHRQTRCFDKEYSRRQVLRFGAAGAGALALGVLPANARGDQVQRKFMLLINLDGGNDSLNTVVPLNINAYHDRRPALGIDEPLALTDGTAATTEFGLHPNLTALQRIYAEGSLAFVNKVGYPNANRSHFTSKDVFHTGDTRHKNARNRDGWVARYAMAHNPQPMGCVSIGYNAKALQAADINLFQARQLSSFTYRADGRYAGESRRRLYIARNMLNRFNGTGNSGKIRSALQGGHDSIDVVEAAVANYVSATEYPENSFGRSLQGVSQLIQANSTDTDIYYTGIKGFDTHGAQGTATWGRHRNLMTTLNGGLSAFAEDMKAQNRWNDCVVVVFSEFGRRNFENGSRGTDHGNGQTMMVMGGRVQGGINGAQLSEADVRDQDSLPMEVDFRQVFGEVIANHLGHDAESVFPDSNRIQGPALALL